MKNLQKTSRRDLLEITLIIQPEKNALRAGGIFFAAVPRLATGKNHYDAIFSIQFPVLVINIYGFRLVNRNASQLQLYIVKVLGVMRLFRKQKTVTETQPVSQNSRVAVLRHWLPLKVQKAIKVSLQKSPSSLSRSKGLFYRCKRLPAPTSPHTHQKQHFGAGITLMTSNCFGNIVCLPGKQTERGRTVSPSSLPT